MLLRMGILERGLQGLPVKLPEVAEYTGFHINTVMQTQRDLPKLLARLEAEDGVVVAEVEEKKRAVYSLEDGLEEGMSEDQEYNQVMTNLFKLSKRSSGAAKIWLQARGLLVEKQEIRHGVTADDITREQIRAGRELREQGFTGIPEVPAERTILPDEVRVHSEREHGEVG